MLHDVYLALMFTMMAVASLRLVFGRVRDEDALVWCIGAVVVNWIVNTLFVLWTKNTDPEMFFFATDCAALAVVMSVRSSPLDPLAASYAGQIISHWLRFSGGLPAWDYWAILTFIGYGQLLILAGWALIPASVAHEHR